MLSAQPCRSEGAARALAERSAIPAGFALPRGAGVNTGAPCSLAQFVVGEVRYLSNQATMLAIFAINWLGRRLMS